MVQSSQLQSNSGKEPVLSPKFADNEEVPFALWDIESVKDWSKRVANYPEE